MSKICPISQQAIRQFAADTLREWIDQFARRLSNAANLRRTPSSVYRFHRWAEAVEKIGPKDVLNFADWVARENVAHLQESQRREQFVAAMDIALSGVTPISLKLTRPQPRPSVTAFNALVCNLDLGEVENRKPFDIEYSRIRYIAIHSPDTVLRIHSCKIGHLVVRPDTRAGIEISGKSVVGTFEIHPRSVSALTVRDSSIVKFIYNGPDCISGKVILKQFWTEQSEKFGATDAQTLRSLRANLNSLHNTLAAGIFHSAELCVDRKHERFFSRRFSHLYEIFSDYGNSISRPMKWFLFSLAGIVAVDLAGDSVQIAVPIDELRGWQHSLETNRWLRAFVFAVHSVLNPLGIFSTRQILISGDPIYAGIFTFLSILGIVAIAFILIGLRRRFRLE